MVSDSLGGIQLTLCYLDMGIDTTKVAEAQPSAAMHWKTCHLKISQCDQFHKKDLQKRLYSSFTISHRSPCEQLISSLTHAQTEPVGSRCIN
eukprot:COSAG06_NODE_8974_length_2021_cov_1.662331_1_plen_91_part_10